MNICERIAELVACIADFELIANARRREGLTTLTLTITNGGTIQVACSAP
jgi:hypothetical protein